MADITIPLSLLTFYVFLFFFNQNIMQHCLQQENTPKELFETLSAGFGTSEAFWKMGPPWACGSVPCVKHQGLTADTLRDWRHTKSMTLPHAPPALAVCNLNQR